MERSVVLLIEEQLGALGLTIEGVPLAKLGQPGQLEPVEVRHGDVGCSFWLTYQPEITFTEVSSLARGRQDRPLLVLGERISERSANNLRAAGVQYLDAAGNAHVAFGSVLIDIRGRRPRIPSFKVDRSGRSVNLFSARKAQVIFAVLTWPDLSNVSVREVAAVAGVSPGLAHETLGLLMKNGYLSSGPNRELRDRDALLDHWAASYPSGLAPTLRLAEFAGEIESIRPATPDQQVFISGEAAVTHLVRPTSLTIYVEELDPMLPIINRWRSDGRPNIMVRRKFWQDPQLPNGQQVGPSNVPWTLSYADLLAAGEPRQRAVARELRKDHAAFREA